MLITGNDHRKYRIQVTDARDRKSKLKIHYFNLEKREPLYLQKDKEKEDMISGYNDQYSQLS
jgi:hypothetical protein